MSCPVNFENDQSLVQKAKLLLQRNKPSTSVESSDRMPEDWKKTADAKRESILAAIPKEWHLEKIPSPEEQKDVTGKYVQQFLTDKEVEITETDAVGIVEKTTSGAWTAVDVIKAFCHRAAIAHQLVS